MTKSTWRVLKLDKKLIVLPIIGFIMGLILTVSIIVGFFALLIFGSFVGFFLVHGHWLGHHQSVGVTGNWTLLFLIIPGILVYLAITTLSNYFSAAIIYGANERFHGNKPTVFGSLDGAWRRIGPLAAFSAVSGTIGFVIQILINRLPFAGKLVAILGGVAWNIATFFAVPMLVLDNKKRGPIEVTKDSSRLVRRVWGEGLVAQAGIEIISALSVLIFLTLALLTGMILSFLHLPTLAIVGIVGIGFLGLLTLAIFLTTLTSIARAAIYHYATTGEAPDLFDKKLLHASMTVKKARRIFA